MACFASKIPDDFKNLRVRKAYNQAFRLVPLLPE
jgi:hypothetical protein